MTHAVAQGRTWFVRSCKIFCMTSKSAMKNILILTIMWNITWLHKPLIIKVFQDLPILTFLYYYEDNTNKFSKTFIQTAFVFYILRLVSISLLPQFQNSKTAPSWNNYSLPSFESCSRFTPWEDVIKEANTALTRKSCVQVAKRWHL